MLREQIKQTDVSSHLPLWKVISLIILFLAIAFGAYTKNEPLLLITCITPLLIYLTLNQPAILALLFAIFSQYRFHQHILLLNHTRPILILGILVFIGFGIKLLKKDLQHKWSRELTLYSIFTVFCIISIPFSTDINGSLSAGETILKSFVIVILITWLLDTKQQFNTYFLLVIFSGLILGCMVIHSYLDVAKVAGDAARVIRIGLKSQIGNENDLATILLIPLGFSLAYLFQKDLSIVRKGLTAFSLCVITVAILLTKSRGGFLGMTTLFGVFGYYKFKSKALLGALMIGGVMALYVVGGLHQRGSLLDKQQWQAKDSSIVLRLQHWETAIIMAIKHPLTGIGLGQSTANYYAYTRHWDGLNRAIHNSYLQVLAEIGFPGFIAYMMMLTILLSNSRKLFFRAQKYHSSHCNKNATDTLTQAQAIYISLCGYFVSASFVNLGKFWIVYLTMAQSVCLRWYLHKLESDQQRPTLLEPSK